MSNLVDEPYRHNTYGGVSGYISTKIYILQNHFMIKLTDEETIWLRGCKSEFEADRVGRQIIKNHWDEF